MAKIKNYAKPKRRRGVKTIRENITLWDGTVCSFRSTVYGDRRRRDIKEKDDNEEESED